MSINATKKVLSIILVLVLAIGMLAGCGGSSGGNAGGGTGSGSGEGSGTTAPPAELKTINVAYMPNYGSLWAIENAIAQGYMKEAGFDVKLTEFQDGPTIIAAMESGSIDIGYIGQGAHKLCINGKATIFALSHISNGDAVIGGKDIKTVADLKGKKVAYSSGTSSESILQDTLAKEGMAMTDIQAVDMDASAIVTAMLSGGVDACATWSPNTLKILEEMADATKLSDNLTFKDTTVSLASWIVMPQYAKDKKEDLTKFTTAIFKAMDYAADDKYEETAKLVAARTAQDQEVAFSQRGDADWLTGKEVAKGAADGTVKNYYELQKQSFIKSGAVENDVPVEDYVLLDLMVEAGKY